MGTHAVFFTAAAQQRLAALNREEAPELAYTSAGFAVLLNVTERRLRALVKRGALPAPDLVVGGEWRWRSSTIEPFRVRVGKPPLDEQLRADRAQACADGAAMSCRGRPGAPQKIGRSGVRESEF